MVIANVDKEVFLMAKGVDYGMNESKVIAMMRQANKKEN